jgi:hypothetical protein
MGGTGYRYDLIASQDCCPTISVTLTEVALFGYW